MAYTQQELSKEFWLLTKGILQDSSVDTEEARVIKRWLEEHNIGGCELVLERLAKFLDDGYIDRFESAALIDSLGAILRHLRQQ